MLSQEIIVVGLAVAISLAAIVVALLAADFARRASSVVILVAGLLIVGVTLFHLAPEAAELGQPGILALLAGVVAGLGLEFAGRHIAGARNLGSGRNVSRFALIALALHSTIDGAIYAVTFSHDQVSGILVALGLVMHEAPEGAVALVLALQTGWKRWQSIVAAVLASSVTTPVGWLMGSIAGSAAHNEIELLFAGSAGLLAYSGVRLVWNGLRRGRISSSRTAERPD